MAGSLRRWHRWTGVVVFIAVAIVAVTGILLNHSEDLRLDERAIANPAVVALYGLDAEPAAEHIMVGDHILIHASGLLYLDHAPVGDLTTPLVGALAIDGGIVAASADRLLLIDREGRLIEAVTESFGLPVPVEAIGTTREGGAAFMADGRVYALDGASLTWRPANAPLMTSSAPSPGLPPDSPVEAPAAAISLEHLLLDLHTGRLLGRLGPWLADLAALGLSFLAASGLIMAFRRRRP